MVFADVSGGYNTGIGSSQKVSSTPLIATTGIGTALTINTTVNAHVGYANGFYASGPSYSSVEGGVLFGYRYSVLGRVTALYNYSQSDSINANFYSEHLVQLTLEQYFAPFVLFVRPELRFREYQGTIVMGITGSTTRNDTIFGVHRRHALQLPRLARGHPRLHPGGRPDRLPVHRRPGRTVDPSYVRQELMLGVRAAY